MRWLLTSLIALAALTAPARAEDRAAVLSPFATPAPRVPLESIDPAVRDKVASVMDKPTLASRSQPETFNTEHAMYRFLLEHPDQGVKLWRQLGAKVSNIDERPGKTYLWHDGQGSEVTWQIVYRAPGVHVWYAEGKVKPALLLPLQPFRAVAVLAYTEGVDTNNLPAVRHQVHFSLKCEGRAIALAARVMGGSAPRLAEQYLGQLQMFYGGLAWYLYQDGERAKKMFKDAGLAYPAMSQ